MAEKRSWRDGYEEYVESKKDNSEEETGGWRNGYKEYSNNNSAQIVGKNVTSKLDEWSKNYNSYITEYQQRFANRKGTLEDEYVSDSADWLTSAKERKAALDEEADAIMSYLDQYGGHLDSKWVDEVRKSIRESKQNQLKILDIAEKDNEYWSQWGGKAADTLSLLPGAENIDFRERAYKSAQQKDGYYKKYEGLSTEDLKWAMEMLEDGKEKEWLTSYAASRDYDDKSKYDVSAGESEIKALEDSLEGLQNYYLMGYDKALENGESYNEFIENWFAKYGGPEAMKKLIENKQKELDEKKQYIADAKKVQEFSKLTGVGDETSEYYDPDYNKYVDEGYALGYTAFGSSKRHHQRHTSATSIDKYRAASMALYEHNGNEGAFDNKPQYDDQLDIYRQMEDEEFDTLAYYIAYDKQHGTNLAEQYVDGIEETLKHREATRISDNITSIDSQVLKDLAVIGYGLVGGADQWAYGVEQFLTGEEASTPVSQYANAYISDSLDGFGYYAHQAATTVGNMAPSILVATVLGGAGVGTAIAQGAGAATMGVSAAGSAYGDALKKGYDKGQARLYSTLVGASEGTLQYLIGGIGSLGGISGKVASKVASIDNSLLRVAAKLGVNIGSEILEEELQNYLEPAFRTIIFGEDYDAPTMDEIIETAIVTALSTGALEGGNVIKEVNADNKAGNQYAGFENELIQEGLESGKFSESYQLAQKYKSKIDSGKSINGAEVRQLVEANEAAFAQEAKESQAATVRKAETKLTELGETSNVSKIAKLVAKQVSGQELTATEKSTLVRSKYGAQVAKEMRGESQAESGKKSFDVAYKSNATYKPLEERVDNIYTTSESGEATIHDTNEAVSLDNVTVARIYADGMTLRVDGKEVSTVDIDFADDSQSYLYSAVSKIENITPGAATAIIRGYDSSSGQTVGEYLNGIDEAYTYGYHGYSEADLKAGNFAPKLTGEQATTAYELGKYVKSVRGTNKADAIKKMRTALEVETEKAKVEGKETPKTKGMTITYNNGNGKVVDFDKAWVKLTAKQKATPALARVMHEMGLGTNFELFASYVNKDGVRVFLDENGVERKAYSGVYRMSDGTVRIDLNAYNGRGLTLNAMAHELTHFIQQWSTEKYEALADFLMKTYEKTDMTMHERVLREQARLKNARGEDVSYNEAYDEVVANAMSKMLDDGKVMDRLNELMAVDMNLAQKLWEGLKKLLNKFFNAYKNESALFHDAADLMELKADFEQLQKMWAEAFVEASGNFQTFLSVSESQTLTDAGIGFDVDTKSVYSLHFSNAYTEQIQVGKKTFDAEAISKLVSKVTGRSITDARKWVQSEMTIANIVMQNPEFLDFEADSRYEAIKKNSDYPQGTVDLSNLCPKREEFTTMFDMLQKKYPNKLFTAQDVADMRKILSDNDITVACGACFVEDRRQLIGEIADTFIGMWKEAVDTGKPLQKTNAAGNKIELQVTKALAKQYGLTAGTNIMATDTYIPNQYDLTTYEGFKLLEKNHPTIAMAFNRYNNSRGQQSARLIEGRAEYKRQILGWSDAKVRTVNNNGGLRIFSFSDFEVVHLLDLVQVIIDCAAKGVKIQGYTKIPAFAKLVRNTGVKLNRSLIPSGDYGYHMENGKVVLDYDTTEGININDENFMDESDNPNVGNIVIGINPTQIGAAMLDPFIDYIIPFHSNKAKEILRKLGTGEWVNYKESQHEKDIATGTSSKHNVNIYTEVINKYHPTNKVEFVEAFLKECKRQGKIPRYAEFLNVDANGDYAYREGYHKLLVDFKMFDAEGNILPQGNITPNLDESFMKDLLNAEIDKKQNYEFPQKVYDDIDKKFGERYSSQETDIDTDQKVTYHKEKTQEVIGNERREETREDFDRRTSTELLTKGQKGRLAYAYRPYLGTAISEKAKTAEKELKKIGIPVFIYEKLETNRQGITINHEKAGAGAIPGVGVFIPFNATVDSMEIVGHEGFHFLATTEARASYIPVLVDNIDFASAEFIAYQRNYVQEKYFEEVVGTESEEFDLLTEEIFAYITGDIHAGDPNGEVHKFLRDYDAVKTAWDDLIKKQATDSLYSSQETDLDSDGNQLTKEQQEFFKDSVIRDKNGKLLVVRHGTSEDFHIFDFSKSGKNGKAEGYGFYFSDDGEITKRYGEIQKEVYLNITKPLYNNKRTIKKADLVKLSNALIDFNLEKYKSDGLVWKDSFISNYVNTYERNMSRSYAVQEFVNQIWNYNTNDQDLVFEIAQADGKMYESSTMKEFYDVLTKTIGYDGIIAEWSHADGKSNVYVTFDSEQSKYTSNKNPTSDPDMRYSTHETDYSNRSLLANAFEGIVKDSIEYKKIQEYKGRIRLLNEYEEKLSELNSEIRKMLFDKDTERDAKRLKSLQDMAKKVAEHIDRNDKELLSLEASEPLRKVIERERKKEAHKTKAHVKELLQNKKERSEQTELRHKIRKTVRDLDKLLNRGNKQRNVKEDMKGFVSTALDLADYLFTDHITNDELIRKGITVRMTPKEAALVKETEDILSKLYDHADSLTDEEFTRLDAKRKANEERLRDLLKAQRNEVQETPVYNLFNDLVIEYASLKNSSQDAVKAAYNDEVERLLRTFIGDADSDRAKALQNMRVADMTTEELWKLYNAYTMVLTTVRDANKFHVQGMNQTIEQVVGQIAGDFSSRKIPEKKLAIAAQKIANKIGWDYEKLYYALDRIGSDAFTKLIMNLADSENIVMQDVIEAMEFRDQIVGKYGFNNWAVNKEIDREFMDNSGKKFKMTLGQMMSLYAYSRREGAWDHIEYGGFVFGEAALTNPKPADSYKLSKAQCEAITNLLTKEQKGYVEAMQKFLSETMGEKGNEVSMKLYGIKMFGEKNYFPIHIAGQFKAQANESQAKAAAGFQSMSNAGFTHAQNPNAKAPFVLEGFNEIWSDHVNEMSRYHGTVPALEDIRRVMNRSTYSDSVAESQSIKQLMENHYGKEAVEYFDNLYREANSGAITDKLQKKAKKLLSLFRKNSVAYSLSVLIQQPASLVRAYAMIDRKYFGFKGVGALTSGVAKAVSSKWNTAYANAYNEMLKYAPGVTMAKEIGGFDTATGGSIRSTLLDTKKSLKQKWNTGTAKEKGKAILDVVDDNAIANLPNVADKIAWIEIWNACKRETLAKHKDLAPTSEEFMQIVGDRFTEVIRSTQVYDSIFSKSPMLKSKNLAVQYLVSFMNEPNTVANMVEKAMRDVTKGNKADVLNGLKTAHVVVHSIIFTNVLKSIVYAMRDDDEDETYIEKYIEAVTGNMMDDFWVLNYIPIARDAWSIAQGYDVERADMAIVADALDALDQVLKNAAKDTEDMTEEQLAEFDKKVTEANWKLVESVASFFGIPMKNIRREINAVIDHAKIASANAGQTTASNVWDTISEAVIDSIPFMTAKEAKTDKLYEAIINGDKDYVNRLKSTYKTESAYNSAVRKALRESDPRIREAAQARYDGNTDEYKRIFREIQNEGKFTFDEIMDAINSEENAIKNKLEPDKVTSSYSASDFVQAVSMGDTETASAARDDIIDTHIANGKTQEEAEEEFASSVKTSTHEAYSAGLLDKTGAENMLIEYADMDEEDATSRVSYWAFCEENPKYAKDISEARYNKYKEYAEPADISLDVFVQYINGTKDLTEIKDEWGDVVESERDQVLEVIDSLPLTWQQKDALYLAHGYAESKIWDVPW